MRFIIYISDKFQLKITKNRFSKHFDEKRRFRQKRFSQLISKNVMITQKKTFVFEKFDIFENSLRTF